MHARKSITKGSPEKIEDAKRVIKEQVLPQVQSLPGFLGGYWLADRETGDGVVFTFFDTEQNLQASADQAQQVRSSATQEIGLEITGVHHLEVVANTGDKVHESASAARVISFEGSPDRIDDAIKNLNENVIPGVKQFSGFLGGFWVIDRSTGKGAGVTLFDSVESVRASEAATLPIRERSAQATGATISQPRVYEVIGRALTPAGAKAG